jgi:hypothetical protein
MCSDQISRGKPWSGGASLIADLQVEPVEKAWIFRITTLLYDRFMVLSLQ